MLECESHLRDAYSKRSASTGLIREAFFARP
jgi:hypothetical protein